MNKSNGLRSLLVTPHSEEFQAIRGVIADALRESGVEPILLEETVAAGTSYDPVPEAIQRADFIIVDFTDSNPSVMYDVGFAHALRKPISILLRKESNISH